MPAEPSPRLGHLQVLALFQRGAESELMASLRMDMADAVEERALAYHAELRRRWARWLGARP